MKLTFSCHYHQLGQKNPTQCYQTEINQLNLGIYLKKKKRIGLMFLQKQKLTKTVMFGPILNCIFYRLKFNPYSEYFPELLW